MPEDPTYQFQWHVDQPAMPDLDQQELPDDLLRLLTHFRPGVHKKVIENYYEQKRDEQHA